MRDQILKLHTLPEAEQVEWLAEHGVFPFSKTRP
jgi:hypothetical protein